jgi:hypothetical protein
MLAAAVTALALRVWFQRGGVVSIPMLGDAAQYCDYAWNLVNYHVFSMAAPGADEIQPDSYRDPGYPLFLAGMLLAWGSGEAWYHAVLLAQAVLGACSVALAVGIARNWLSPGWALVVGFGVALWPHNVAISGFLLSETLFGFLALLALWTFTWAVKSSSPARWALAGLCLGAAALVNATLTLFGPLLTVAMLVKRAAPRHLLAAMLLGCLVAPGGWGLRSLGLPAAGSGYSRAVANLVQGSWPDYQWAANAAYTGDPAAQRIQAAIGEETKAATASVHRWLPLASARFASDPLHYLVWYLWKPELLWAWSIRVGAGDIYPYHVQHPIFSSVAALRLLESLCFAVNPLLLALAAVAMMVVLIRPVKTAAESGLYAVALLAAYETLVYTVLQAEPRYSIPFRPVELMLAVTMAATLASLWKPGRTGAGNGRP